MKKSRLLFQMINGEPYLVDGEVDTSWKGRWFFPKCVEKDQILLGNPPLPLTVDSLRQIAKNGECINTDEVAEVNKCSRLTVLRHVASGRLKPVPPIQAKGKRKRTPVRGNGFLFRASEVLKWMDSNPIKVGRPKQKTNKRSPKRRH